MSNTTPALLELPERKLSALDKDRLRLVARYVCNRHPGNYSVGFHTRDRRIVRELQQRHVRAVFIKGDGVPGWWFIYAHDVLQQFGWGN